MANQYLYANGDCAGPPVQDTAFTRASPCVNSLSVTCVGGAAVLYLYAEGDFRCAVQPTTPCALPLADFTQRPSTCFAATVSGACMLLGFMGSSPISTRVVCADESLQPSPQPVEKREIGIDKTTAKFKTTLVVMLSGDVAEFTDAVQLAMKEVFAHTVGVSIDQVDLLITAASVRADYVTYSSSREAMNQVESAVKSELGTRDAIISMFSTANIPAGVTPTSDPQISITLTDEDSSSSVGLIIGVAIGGVFGGVLLIGLAIFIMKGRSVGEPMRKPVLKMEHVNINANRPPSVVPSKRGSVGLASPSTKPPPSYSSHMTQAGSAFHHEL